MRDDVPPPERKYLAIYEVEGDFKSASDAMMQGVKDATIPLDEAMDMENLTVDFYTAI
jgi:hypothetical protein